MVDLISGIGGLHTALCAAVAQLNEAQGQGACQAPRATDSRSAQTAKDLFTVASIRPFDVNAVANKVYQHNFGVAPSSRGIDALRPHQVRNSNLWLMSPPCQPYTRFVFSNVCERKGDGE